MSRYIRSELLLGEDATQKLRNSKVIVFGVGGVGSYVVEALARAGVGTVAIVDDDTVAESNLNRQLIATAENIGEEKTEEAKKRIQAVNPDCRVVAVKKFLTKVTFQTVSTATLQKKSDHWKNKT